MLIATAGVVLVVGGANLRHLLKLGALALALIIGFVLMASYRVERFTAFLDPWSEPQGASYQLIQSLYAIAHGGVTGAGFGQSIQKYFYLPFRTPISSSPSSPRNSDLSAASCLCSSTCSFCGGC